MLLGLGVTVLTAGLAQSQGALHVDDHGRRSGVALWYPLQYFFYENMSLLRLLVLLVVAIAVGIGVGYAVRR